MGYIATCGHRVEEGISCMINEYQYDSDGNKLLSYGTYCSSCIIDFYIEGRLRNTEICDLIFKLKHESVLATQNAIRLELQNKKMKVDIERLTEERDYFHMISELDKKE